MKKKLLLWSGGFDSTALLITHISNGIEFDLCYCILPNNKVMQDIELRARRIILKKLLAMYPDHKYGKDLLYTYVDTLSGVGNMFPQPYVWGTTLAWNIDIDKYDEIVMGYVKYDDFWHIRTEFEQLVNISLKLLKGRDATIKFVYPYEWHTKDSILKDVYQQYNLGNILRDIEMCENTGECNIGTRCGSCARHLAEFGHIVNSKVNYRNM